ncbi:16243_t:CDS:2, partial [Entrophospora sp. SA101]
RVKEDVHFETKALIKSQNSNWWICSITICMAGNQELRSDIAILVEIYQIPHPTVLIENTNGTEFVAISIPYGTTPF